MTTNNGLDILKRRYLLLFMVMGVLLVLVCVLSLFVGAKSLSLSTVWTVLLSPGDNLDSTIIWQSRIPRTVAGIIVGMSLGVSGTIMQYLTRNPLADPGILGINAGAMFVVILAISFLGITQITDYIWYALLGAALTSILVILVGNVNNIDTLKLTLAGVAISAILTGLSYIFSLLYTQSLDQIRFWSAGTLDIQSDNYKIVIPFVVVGILLAFAILRQLDSFVLGRTVAISQGVNIRWTYLIAIIAISLLCGSSTALVGPISFVGLMIPHMARLLVGYHLKRILILSLLLGPLILLLADVFGRVIATAEIRVSIVTAFIGAPIMIWLLNRRSSL